MSNEIATTGGEFWENCYLCLLQNMSQLACNLVRQFSCHLNYPLVLVKYLSIIGYTLVVLGSNRIGKQFSLYIEKILLV